jgi:hypothetical protein
MIYNVGNHPDVICPKCGRKVYFNKDGCGYCCVRFIKVKGSQ